MSEEAWKHADIPERIDDVMLLKEERNAWLIAWGESLFDGCSVGDARMTANCAVQDRRI